MGIAIKSEKRINSDNDHHYQTDDGDANCDRKDENLEGFAPADMRMPSSHEALDKEEIDNIENDCSRGDENLGGNGEGNTFQVVNPGYTKGR